MAAVREAGAAERVYYCGSMAALHEVRAADAGAEIAMTWTTSLRPAGSLLADLGPRWLNLRFALADPATIAWARDHGLLVGVVDPRLGALDVPADRRRGGRGHHQPPDRPSAPAGQAALKGGRFGARADAPAPPRRVSPM